MELTTTQINQLDDKIKIQARCVNEIQNKILDLQRDLFPLMAKLREYPVKVEDHFALNGGQAHVMCQLTINETSDTHNSSEPKLIFKSWTNEKAIISFRLFKTSSGEELRMASKEGGQLASRTPSELIDLSNLLTWLKTHISIIINDIITELGENRGVIPDEE